MSAARKHSIYYVSRASGRSIFHLFTYSSTVGLLSSQPTKITQEIDPEMPFGTRRYFSCCFAVQRSTAMVNTNQGGGGGYYCNANGRVAV